MGTKCYLRVFVAFVAVLLFSSVSLFAGEPYTVNVSGEIVWVDVKLGSLQLKTDANQNARGIEEYRINQNETRVTDPSDQKFLTIADLRPGQHVTMEVIYNQDEKVIRKITAEPYLETHSNVVVGEIADINVPAGTLTIAEERSPGEGGRGHLSYFVFETNRIIIVENQSMKPMPLELRVGDMVKVGFIEIDGSLRAYSIALLSRAPETTTTTTTTTISTTVKE